MSKKPKKKPGAKSGKRNPGTHPGKRKLGFMPGRKIPTDEEFCVIAHTAIKQLFIDACGSYFYPQMPNVQTKIEDLYEDMRVLSILATDQKLAALYKKLHGSLDDFTSLALLSERLLAIHPHTKDNSINKLMATKPLQNFATSYKNVVVTRLSESSALYSQAKKVKDDIAELYRSKNRKIEKANANPNDSNIKNLINIQKKIMKQELEGEKELLRIEEAIRSAKFDNVTEEYLLTVTKYVLDSFKDSLQRTKFIMAHDSKPE